MSATSEILYEQIRMLEEAVSKADAEGSDSTSLRKDLSTARSRLASVNQALTEGKVLKG